jgi:hypothetical protein
MVPGSRRGDDPSFRASSRSRRPDVSTSASKDDDVVGNGLRNLLGFFKERVDMTLEDTGEAGVSRIIAPASGDTAVRDPDGTTKTLGKDDRALWAVDLSLFGRARARRTAGYQDHLDLRQDVFYGKVYLQPRDQGVHPSRRRRGKLGFIHPATETVVIGVSTSTFFYL